MMASNFFQLEPRVMKAIIPHWQQALQEMITSPEVLLATIELTTKDIPWQWDPHFPLRVSQSYVRRIKKGDPHDPLLRQVLSLKEESQKTNNYSADPLQEKSYNPLPGCLHKYGSRVLLTFTGSCAIHCRYCFRRHFPYAQNNPGRNWDPFLDYLKNHPEVIEVILSGGDPLMAQDQTIAAFVEALSTIPQIQLLRFHTRFPVVIPERITRSFLNIFEHCRLQKTMIYHINHPAEITPEIAQGVRALKQHQFTVLNQSVLLKEVNDNAACLKALSMTLFQAGILPYYVHLLDPVEGAAHFFVPLEKAKILQTDLRHALPGYLVPQFVREVPGALSKTPIDLL